MEPDSSEPGRRQFLKTTAAVLAGVPAVLRAQSPNNRLRVGWIAAGGRGQQVMKEMYRLSNDMVTVTAVCDAYRGHRDAAQAIVQSNENGHSPKTYIAYRELLADPNVDVVFICSPEHLHFPMAMAAIEARKHIYLEKPIAHTLEEGQKIVDAAHQSDRIVQVGTQNRSNKLYIRAKEMVANGDIGEIHYVRAFWYRNFDASADPTKTTPAPWRYLIPADADPENTDFPRFLEGAAHPDIPFSKERYFQWRNYWDYSSGIATDLLVHQTDASNFVCNQTVPSTCMASGGIYEWGRAAHDDREVPDTFSAIYEYPDHFHLNYSCFFGNDQYGYGEQFMGHDGTIEVLDRQNLHFYPQPRFIKGHAPFSKAAELHLNNLKDFQQPDSTADHVHNFLMAVLGKEPAIAPASAGQIAAIPGHLATLSFKNNRKILWDASSSEYHFT